VNYANKLLSDRDESEEVVQHLFVSLWEKRDSVEIEGSEKSHLMRATHNACLNHIKHKKIKQLHAQHIIHTADEAEHRDLLVEEEFRQNVNDHIQKLPTECRKIFLMSREQGLKYQQIADELNLSVKTVENQMGKALKQLRTALNPSHNPTLNVISTIFWMIIGVNLFSVVIK
jgi:RNA polymerase sigma-70 factor, ECF subfamily